MKFTTAIYVTKDNSPGIDSFAEKKYDEQFNRIDGTVELDCDADVDTLRNDPDVQDILDDIMSKI